MLEKLTRCHLYDYEWAIELYLRKNKVLAFCFYFKQYGDTLEKQMCSLYIYTVKNDQ